MEKYSYRQPERVGTQLVRHVCSSWVVGSDVSVYGLVHQWMCDEQGHDLGLSLSLYSSSVPAGWWHFLYVMPTPSEGPWWPVYTAEWCGCILTVLRLIFPWWFPVAFPVVFVFPRVLLWCVVRNCRGFTLTSLSLTISQLLIQAPCVQFVRWYRVTCTQSQHLGRFVI